MEEHPVAEPSTDLGVLLADADQLEVEQLRTALLRAEEAMGELATELRCHRPDWNATPVVLRTYPQGRPSIGAYVEDTEISFVFGCGQTRGWGGVDEPEEWIAEAEVYVDGPQGRNELVHLEERSFPDALSAAEGLSDAIRSIAEQIRDRPPAAMLWRAGH